MHLPVIVYNLLKMAAYVVFLITSSAIIFSFSVQKVDDTLRLKNASASLQKHVFSDCEGWTKTTRNLFTLTYWVSVRNYDRYITLLGPRQTCSLWDKLICFYFCNMLSLNAFRTKTLIYNLILQHLTSWKSWEEEGLTNVLWVLFNGIVPLCSTKIAVHSLYPCYRIKSFITTH